MNLLTRISIIILIGSLSANPGFAQTPTATPYPNFLRDLNHDGVIDSQDLLILLQGWGLQGIATPTPTSTPTFTSAPIFTNTPILPPTETFTATPSPSATETSTPSSTHTPTSTDTSTGTPTETATETPTPEPTETPTSPNAFTVDLDFPTPFPLRMIRIPAGSFMMGSPDTERSRTSDEGPIHPVTLANDFYMGQTEVTQAQWEFVMGSLPAIDSGVGDNHPVYSVSWLECQDFLTALNTLSSEGTFRLPTEAEWEYACRAGTTKRFYFGNSLGCDDECEDCEAEEEVIGGGKSLPWESTASPLEFEPNLPLPFNLLRSDFMWFCANFGGDSQRVRSLRPNAFGLYDMSGNVREWCQDLHHDNYSGAPNDGSAWVSGEGIQRVVRGGSRGNFARSCRSAYRVQGFNPSSKFLDTGFRLVWTP